MAADMSVLFVPPLSLFCHLRKRVLVRRPGWQCALHGLCMPGSLAACWDHVIISGHNVSCSWWIENSVRLLKGGTAHCPPLLPPWCMAFRDDGQCSRSHLDPKVTLRMETMIWGWWSRKTEKAWVTDPSRALYQNLKVRELCVLVFSFLSFICSQTQFQLTVMVRIIPYFPSDLCGFGDFPKIALLVSWFLVGPVSWNKVLRKWVSAGTEQECGSKRGLQEGNNTKCCIYLLCYLGQVWGQPWCVSLLPNSCCVS